MVWLRVGLRQSYSLLLNTAKNTRDPFAIRVRVKEAYIQAQL